MLYGTVHREAAPTQHGRRYQIWESSVITYALTLNEVCQKSILCIHYLQLSSKFLIINLHDLPPMKAVAVRIGETKSRASRFMALNASDIEWHSLFTNSFVRTRKTLQELSASPVAKKRTDTSSGGRFWWQNGEIPHHSQTTKCINFDNECVNVLWVG